MSGGGQERGLRSGTLPTHLVVGLGMACQVAKEVGREADENPYISHPASACPSPPPLSLLSGRGGGTQQLTEPVLPASCRILPP